jgi:hypothetical protein
MSKPMEKVLYEDRDKCPWCSKLINTRVVRVTTTPGVKAETSIKGTLEKVTQTTLSEDYEDSLKPKKKTVKRKAF